MYGDLFWVDMMVFFCSEMIVVFWEMFLDELILNEIVVRFFYVGIVGDIGCFLYLSIMEEMLCLFVYLVIFLFDCLVFY